MAHVDTTTSTDHDVLSVKLDELRDLIVQNPTLDAIAAGAVSQDNWRQFAIQRYLIALPFRDLLVQCVKVATEFGDEELKSVLERNLQEEDGINLVDGEIKESRSHEKWRRDFYTALGISENELEDTPSYGVTQNYETVLRECIENRRSYEQLGALLMLESSIPFEFAKLAQGRDRTFPDAFMRAEGDTRDVHNAKARARLYLDHHVLHDVKYHFPQLRDALLKHADDPEILAKMIAGMELIAKARREFYDGMRRVVGIEEDVKPPAEPMPLEGYDDEE